MKSHAIILADAPHAIFSEQHSDFPAGLLKISGKTVLAHQVDAFTASGVPLENITIVVGHAANSILEYLKNEFPAVKIAHNTHTPFHNRCLALLQGLQLAHTSQNWGGTLFLALNSCVFSRETIKQLCEYSAGSTFAKGLHGGEKPCLYKIAPEDITKAFACIAEHSQPAHKQSCIFNTLSGAILFTEYKENQHGLIRIHDQASLLTADKLLSSFNFRGKKAFFFDFDGTLFVGNTPIEGAIDFLKKHSESFDFYFLTNNTSRTPAEYLGKLAKVGINIDEEQVVTPLHALFDYIQYKKYTSVYLIANQKVKDYVQKNLPGVHLDFDMEKNQAAVLAFDTELTYEKLKNLAVMLNNRNDLEYIATHGDFFCPHEQGPIPDVGGMIAMIQATNGHTPHTVLGKPSVHLIQRYIERYGKENIVVVGDRLYTDKKLADNADCDFICVLSGETLRTDLVHDTSRYPAIVVSDLGQIDC